MCRGHGRVHISDHHDQVRSLIVQYLFIGHHDLAGLFRMGTATHAEMDVGFRQTKVLKKGIGHIGIIVLAGMDDNGRGPMLFLQRMVKGRHFHEIGPGGTDEMNSHFAIQLHPILFSKCGLERK